MTPSANASPPGPADSTGSGRRPKHIVANLERDPEGKPKFFTLTLGNETVTLNPGKGWMKADEYKWGTRGLIEAPQSFHVEANGTVDINGEKIHLDDPEGLAKLEHEINKHHVATAAPRAAKVPGAGGAAGDRPHGPRFKVKLDHFGHLTIECARGAEKIETGVKGMPSLVQNGLMLAPKQFHADPLHRGLELDHTWYEATEAGARQLEAALNTHYAPQIENEKDAAIEVRENPAAATGFDIHFVTTLSGSRFEVKGHLSQERLDVLQDPAKCDLLQPGIVLRMSPPNLLFRRRRPDGGEEPIPEFPDIQYRRVTAHQLQHLLNHPVIRRTAGSVAATVVPVHQGPPEYAKFRVLRHPQNKALLWLECVPADGSHAEGKALTHHNVAALQTSGTFLPHLDVTLSLDNRTLGILDKTTHQEETFTVDSHSADADLAHAGRLLTAALKPPSPHRPEISPALSPVVGGVPVVAAPAVSTSVPPPAPAPAQPLLPEPVALPPASRPAPPRAFAEPAANAPVPVLAGPATADAPVAMEGDPAVLALFADTSPLAVNLAVFASLGARLGVPTQDLLLTLPRAFTDRRFQVLSFSHPEVDTILDLRSESFYGFYLSHVSEQKVLLVYACKGRHIEWGPDRSLLQPAVTAEPNEFKASALLGLVQDADGNFVFVVTPAYLAWVKAYEKAYLDVCARFLTPRDLAVAPDNFAFIWPERAEDARPR